MFKAGAACAVDVPTDKAVLVQAIVGLCLPGFPYDHFYGGSKDTDEQEADD